jgi:hypothetical protein
MFQWLFCTAKTSPSYSLLKAVPSRGLPQELEWSKNWNALKKRDVRLAQSLRSGLAFTSLSRIEFSLTQGSTAEHKN